MDSRNICKIGITIIDNCFDKAFLTFGIAGFTRNYGRELDNLLYDRRKPILSRSNVRLNLSLSQKFSILPSMSDKEIIGFATG